MDDDQSAVSGGSRTKEEYQNKNHFKRFLIALNRHFFSKFSNIKTIKYAAAWNDYQHGGMPVWIEDGLVTKLVIRVRWQSNVQFE